jgi:Domain of unknown function (DUF4129)
MSTSELATETQRRRDRWTERQRENASLRLSFPPSLRLFASVALWLCGLTLYFAPEAFAQGISTVGDYADRLERAEQSVDEVIELESPAKALVVRMNSVKRLLPEREEVQFNGSIVRVDNAWLHEAVDKVIGIANGDLEQRNSTLIEISSRLARLKQSVKESQTAQDRALKDQRALLEKILARPEYQPEEKRDSMIGRLIKRIKEFIYWLLEKLFGVGPARAPQTGGGGLVAVFRILVLLAVIAALLYGAVRLTRRLQGRQSAEEKKETREALGEEIAEDLTAADLFANATELARQGEYRKAIRRAYIALLCDLEQRGKLRLGRSKTNRDYLDAIRPEQVIYPTFSVMTNAFENVWYGQGRATEDEFQNFVTHYREVVK